MIKTFSILGLEGNFLKFIKNICKKKKSTTNVILIGEKLKAFVLRSSTRQGCLPLPFLVNIVLVVLANAIKTKGNKWYTDWEGKNKTDFVRGLHDCQFFQIFYVDTHTKKIS